MARCAGLGVIAGYTSESCAPRSPGGRVAQLKQIVEGKLQAVARRAGWVGATRHYEIQVEMVVTD
ncbi:hypothetical protein A2U01_0071962, partial [Trifolium medium]|nr:hypothetical protein [Trifolium medium]